MAKEDPEMTIWVGIYADHGSVPTPQGEGNSEVMVGGRYFKIVRDSSDHPIGFGIVLASAWPESEADGKIAEAEDRVAEVQTWFDEWSFPHNAAVCTLTAGEES